jgi:hypothetical protein
MIVHARRVVYARVRSVVSMAAKLAVRFGDARKVWTVAQPSV